MRRITGFYPNSTAPYRQALMHKSIHRQQKGRHQNNERLEFLGDAILDAVVADILYNRYGNKSEGFLTKNRSKIVKRESLNHIARQMGLQGIMQTDVINNTHNSSLPGNALEAFIGAIYVDRGYKKVKQFVSRKLFNHYIDIEKTINTETNFKSVLIEWCQKRHMTAEFRLVSQTTDRENNPVFVSQAVIAGIEGEKGRGYSKKESEQNAAKNTIRQLRESQRRHRASIRTEQARGSVNGSQS